MKTNTLIFSLGIVVVGASVAWAQSSTLQDIAGNVASPRLPKVTIYVAKEIITLDPSMPKTEAVAVVGSDLTDDAWAVDLNAGRDHANGFSDRGRRQMINAQMRAETFLVRLQMRCQNVAGRQLHVVGQ